MSTTGFLVQLYPDCDAEAVRAAVSMIRGVARVDDHAPAAGPPAAGDRLFQCLEQLVAMERAERGNDQGPCVL